MNQEDDLSPDTERTIIMPRPGGRKAGLASPEPPPATGTTTGATQPVPPVAPTHTFAPLQTGDNPLVNNAAVLLGLISTLRSLPHHADAPALRAHILEEIKAFEVNTRNLGATPEDIFTARYLLCAVLDETVLSTNWGGESAWSKQSLLSTFHNETWGGEKFFLILDRLLQDPARHINLLELIYLCLSFGFEGKYRVLEGGRSKLDERREQLHIRLLQLRGEFVRELSPHWQAARITVKRKQGGLPLWLIGALCIGLLVVLYAGFSLLLGKAGQPLTEQLQAIERSVPAP